MKPCLVVLLALGACTSITEPTSPISPPSASLSFHLDAKCPGPLSLDFFIDDDLREWRMLAAGDSVVYDVKPGEHRLTVQLNGTPFGWTPVVDVGLGQRLRLLLQCS